MAKYHIWVLVFIFSATIGISASEGEAVFTLVDISEGEAVFTLMDPCTPLMEAATSSRKDWYNISSLIEENKDNFQELAMQCLSWLKTDPLIAQSSINPKTNDEKVSQRRIRQTGPIYPGTKWCGPGDLATNYRDLGELSKEDRCCRKHDMCPEQIIRGQCMNGLCNSSPFTRSHCECDERFRQCLQSLKSPAADTIGALYFNIGSNICFAESYNATANSVGKSSEIRSESERKDLEVWRKTRAVPSLKTVTRRKISDCSRKHMCPYKYYSQHPYVEATERKLMLPASSNGPQQKRRSSRQSKYNDDEISTIGRTQIDGRNEKQNPPAETISTFLYHLLRSTGVLLPKGL